MFFEGSEKKFELHTTSSQPSLRKLGNPFFEQMVKKSEATILSKISNEKCDAYLLSESSLFVYDHKLLMITCGCTILIRSLLEVLKKIPLEGIGFLSFERKDENFPQLQYTSFEEDLQVLKKHVPGDNIYLGDKKGRHIALFYTDKPYSPPTEDLTIEVLMNGLGKESFFSQNHSFRSAQELRQKSGLDTIVPGFTIDDYLFQPQGYSLNAIKGLWYYSIHITPQNPGSYVSFETNYPFGINTTLSSTEAMLNKLFSIFAPNAYSLLYFHKSPLLKVTHHKSFKLRTETLKKLKCGYYIHFYECLRSLKKGKKNTPTLQLEQAYGPRK